MEFNTNAKALIQTIIDNSERFKLIVLWGELGTGKTYVVKDILARNNIAINNIVFSTESFFPLGLFSYEEWLDNNEFSILEKCTEKLSNGESIVFQNMEKCGSDYKQLIFQLLSFHKINDNPIIIILEYNVSDKPDDKLCHLTDNYVEVKEKCGVFNEYLQSHFTYSPKNELFFAEIIKMANNNITFFFSILTILEKTNVISVDDKEKYQLINCEFYMPKSILTLYLQLLDTLEEKWKEPLYSSAPFSMCIYENILHEFLYQYDEFKKYLHVMSEDFSLLSISTENTCMTAKLFQTTYSFSTTNARDAVLTKLDVKYKSNRLSDFYNYFLRIYDNKSWYNKLSQTDKILLLYNLAKIRKNPINVNQIAYITELISYYYENFMYLNAIDEAQKLIEANVLNPIQLNKEAPMFWSLYFKSLLTIGDYESVILYKDIFCNNDLDYYIALAMYEAGKPLDALNYLNLTDEKHIFNIGYKYSLLSAIYDWIGNSKKSRYYFSKALSKCDKDENLKYQLYKKYNMHVDLRIEECQINMKQAINYYKTRNLRQYAECLHNYGTGCIFIFEYSIASINLENSINVLKKICSNEVYYALNSLAILRCYSDLDYRSAITLWEEALQYSINEKFCKLAILNNLFNIYIYTDKMQLAKQKKNEIKNYFLTDCLSLDDIPGQHPDIQHQLRQYFYNCGLLYKKEKRYEESLEAFVRAKKSSSYNSVVTYSIDRYIKELSKVIHKKTLSFNNIKLLHPTPIEDFIFNREMYLCEIMFWG